MAFISIFTRRTPSISSLQFDAVLETTFEAPVEFTDYPISSGARAIDHGIINPYVYTMTIAVSNNPLRTTASDVVSGVINGVFDNPIIANSAGILANVFNDKPETRSATVLESLVALRLAREPFDVDTGELILQNMVITNITQNKTPENEGGLIAVVSMQELATLDTVLNRTSPVQSQLRVGDPSQTQATTDVNYGDMALSEVSSAINSLIDRVVG